SSNTLSCTGLSSGTCSIENGSTDLGGAVLLTFMTGPGATSGKITVNFSSPPFGVNPPKCVANLGQGNTAGHWDPRATIFPEIPTTTSQTFDWDNNGQQIGLILASVYRMPYQCTPN